MLKTLQFCLVPAFARFQSLEPSTNKAHSDNYQEPSAPLKLTKTLLSPSQKNPHHCPNVPTSYFSWPAAPSSSLPPLGFPAAADIPCNLSRRAGSSYPGVCRTQGAGVFSSSLRAKGIYEAGLRSEPAQISISTPGWSHCKSHVFQASGFTELSLIYYLSSSSQQPNEAVSHFCFKDEETETQRI